MLLSPLLSKSHLGDVVIRCRSETRLISKAIQLKHADRCTSWRHQNTFTSFQLNLSPESLRAEHYVWATYIMDIDEVTHKVSPTFPKYYANCLARKSFEGLILVSAATCPLRITTLGSSRSAFEYENSTPDKYIVLIIPINHYAVITRQRHLVLKH